MQHQLQVWLLLLLLVRRECQIVLLPLAAVLCMVMLVVTSC